MIEIELRSIVTNIDNAREPSPRLQSLGYGIVEPIEGKDKSSLFALALGTPDDKIKFIALIEQHDEGIVCLAESIDQQGQLQSCQVRQLGNDRNALIFGCRRCLALLYLHAKNGRPATVMVTNTDKDETAAVIASAAENIHLPPSYIDQGKLFKRLEDEGMTTAEIARRIPMGKSAEQLIRIRRRLLELPQGIQQKIHNGKMSQVEALKMLRRQDHKKNNAIESLTQLRKPEKQNIVDSKIEADLQTALKEFVTRLRAIDIKNLAIAEPDELLPVAKEAGTLISAVKKVLSQLQPANAT